MLGPQHRPNVGSIDRPTVDQGGVVPTIRITRESCLQPDRVLTAARDFTARRCEIFPAVQPSYFELHSTGEHSADVTEGTRLGPMFNWERCDYDWSKPDGVLADVTDSNV